MSLLNLNNENYQIDICPVVIKRLAGLTLNIIGDYYAEGDRLSLSAYRRLSALLCASKTRLLLKLEIVIGTLPYSEERFNLIKLKRDLYNDRFSSVTNSDGVGEVDSELEQLIVEYQQACVAYCDLRQLRSDTVLKRINSRVKHMREIFTQSDAARAMVLSAPGFWRRIVDSETALCANRDLSKEEYTLLQYISRASTKTSPFSYFGPVQFGEIGQVCSLGELGIGKLKSIAVFNSQGSFGNIRGQNDRKVLRTDLVFNDSLTFVGGKYYWVTQSIESDHMRCASVFKNKSIESIVNDYLIRRDPIAWRSLSEDLIEALVKHGLLVPFQQERQDMITGPRSEGMSQAQERTCRRSQCTDVALGSISTYEAHAPLARFNNADARERIVVLDEIYKERFNEQSLVNTHYSHLNQDAISNAIAKGLIREDVIANNIDIIPEKSLSKLVKTLAAYESIASEFSFSRRTLAGLANFYKLHFNARESVPFLEFVKLLFDHIKGRSEQNERAGRIHLWAEIDRIIPFANEGLIAHLRSFVDIRESKAQKLSAGWHAGIDVRIKPSHKVIGNRPISGALVQCSVPLPEVAVGAEALWVVNELGLGCGRSIRRWLSYNQQSATRFREWAQKYIDRDDEIDCGISDDVYFHADYGKSIFRKAINIPGGRFKGSCEGVSLSDLSVRLVSETELGLWQNKCGRRVYANYESMLALSVRPWLTQLLSLFGRDQLMADSGSVAHQIALCADLHPPTSISNNQGSKIVHFPRITIDDNVVVRRSTWYVPNTCWPKVPPNEAASTVAEIYCDWAYENNLPSEVFIASETERRARLKGGSAANDKYKPQYINFDDDIWCVFLHKYRRRTDGISRIVEALPRIGDGFGLQSLSERRIVELALHWAQ